MRDKRIKGLPTIVVTVRIEPNAAGSHVLWSVHGSDQTKANGFAKSPGDAMRDAAAFVDAMAQPRVGGLFAQAAPLRVIGGKDDAP